MIAASVAVGLILGGGAGYALSSYSAQSSHSPGTIAEWSDGKPHIVSTAELRSFSPILGTVYWAGERPGKQLELTVEASAIYIRYVNGASDSNPALTVATYRDIAGYASLSSLGKDADVKTSKSGAVLANSTTHPGSTYFAFPSGSFEVEVFSPTTGDSRHLVESGDVVPVSTRSKG